VCVCVWCGGVQQNSLQLPSDVTLADDGGSLDQGFWGNVSDQRVRHIHRHGHLHVGRKHTEMAKVACGEFMAIFDDDDYYGPDYLGFMLGELVERNVSLIKLGSWAQFMGHWEGAELSGSMWHFDVSKTKAGMGYGFTYFFTRAAGQAPVTIPRPDKFNWDGQWIGKLKAAGYRVALTTTHPSLLVIKIQHGDNLSRPISSSLKPMAANTSHVKALLDPTLLVKILPADPDKRARGQASRLVYRAPPAR
jgi:hypothetical protein